MTKISDEAIEAAAKFWEFLGHHGTAQVIRERKGFRTTAEVFAQFEETVTAPLLAYIAALEEERDHLLDDRSSRSAERALICQDKDVNNVIQTRIETGSWRINPRGFLVLTGGAFT